MDVKVSYRVRSNKQALIAQILPKVMLQLEGAIQKRVDLYVTDLERHMGGIHGGSAYSDGKVKWDALDDTQLKEAPRFWIESGRAKRSVSVNMKVEGNSIQAFVGVSEGADGYQEVLWNELGFTPANGDKLIRRPLFIPLAEVHKKELEGELRTMLQSGSIQVEI